MERKYLRYFVAVLVAGIVTGLVLNAYYDFSARAEITGLVKELFACARAGDSEKYARKTYIMDAYIYGDLGVPEVSARENGLSELYAEVVSGGLTFQSISFVKIVERLSALVTIKAADSAGAQREIYLVLIRETDRRKKERWLPYRILTPEQDRKEVVSRAKQMLDADEVKKEARESVLNAALSVERGRERAFGSVSNLLNAPDVLMGQVRAQAQSLLALITDEVLRNECAQLLEREKENPSAALTKILSPRARFRNLVARLKAVSDAKPEDAKETAQKLAGSAAQLQGGANSLLGTIRFCAMPEVQRRSELVKRIGQINLRLVPAEQSGAFAERLQDAESKLEVDLSAIFAKVKEAASSPAVIHKEKVEAVDSVIRKMNIPSGAKEQVLEKLAQLRQESDFVNFADEVAFVCASEEAMRFSFLAGLSGPAGYLEQALASQSTRSYIEGTVKAAIYDASISTSSIISAMEFDSSLAADIYQGLVSQARGMVTRVKDSAVAPERNLRRQSEGLVSGLPNVWAKMSTEEEFLGWAFPGGLPANDRVVAEAKDFFGRIKGKNIEIANVHQFHDRYRTCAVVIVRVILDSDKYGKWVDEKYEETKAKYEQARKDCREAKKMLRGAQKRYKESDKEYQVAKQTYENLQKEHRSAKEAYEQARASWVEAKQKRLDAVLSLILIQKMTPDWGVGWSVARTGSIYHEEYKNIVRQMYDEEIVRRQEILFPAQ